MSFATWVAFIHLEHLKEPLSPITIYTMYIHSITEAGGFIPMKVLMVLSWKTILSMPVRIQGFISIMGKKISSGTIYFALNIRSQLQATRIEEHRSLSFTNNIIYFDRGTLLSSNWHKFNLFTDKNIYWDTRTKDIRFGDKSFAEWKKSGKDIHSIIADPLFVNPSTFDFHLKKNSVAKRIGFVPFDYSAAGVYGSEEWKNLAKFDAGLEIKFDNIVNQSEIKTIIIISL